MVALASGSLDYETTMHEGQVSHLRLSAHSPHLHYSGPPRITFLIGVPRVETLRAYREEIEDLFKPSLQAILTAIEEQQLQMTIPVKVCALILLLSSRSCLFRQYSWSEDSLPRITYLPRFKSNFKSKIFKYPDQVVILYVPSCFRVGRD